MFWECINSFYSYYYGMLTAYLFYARKKKKCPFGPEVCLSDLLVLWDILVWCSNDVPRVFSTNLTSLCNIIIFASSVKVLAFTGRVNWRTFKVGLKNHRDSFCLRVAIHPRFRPLIFNTLYPLCVSPVVMTFGNWHSVCLLFFLYVVVSFSSL